MALVAMCMAAGSAIAESTPLTLAEAVARAGSQAPQLKGAEAALHVADAIVRQSGLRSNPTLSLEAENVMGSRRYSGFGGGEKAVRLSMPLELGGKRSARMRVAQSQRAAAGIGARSAEAELTVRITEAFVTLAASERYVAIANAGHELAARAHHAARERVPDITNTQVQINVVAPALAPADVERQVTYPIETAFAGIPGLESTRSLKRVNASMPTRGRRPVHGLPGADRLKTSSVRECAWRS